MKFFKFTKENLGKFVRETLNKFKDESFFLFFLNLFIIFFQIIYISLRYQYINSVIPFWYTLPWGDLQLAPKNILYIIPITSIGLLFCGVLLIFINRFYIRYFKEVIWAFIIFCNLCLSASMMRIILKASNPFEPFINPIYLVLLIPFALSFIVANFILPLFIDYANQKKLVTDPSVHNHPAMVLKFASARGGGVVYGVIFLVMSFIFVGFSKQIIGLYLSVFMVSFLGLIDDIQNTRPVTSLKVFENPVLRLILLFASVLPAIFSGFLMHIVTNPLGGTLNLSIYTLQVGENILPIISGVVTALWFVWVMNVLSWSNGIDGQYCGIVGIASVIIALLALRFNPIETSHIRLGTLAAISAGVAFGFTRYTWNPSKIMWGFGAVSAGLVISALSISTQTKIVTSILIVLIPFLDALVTVVRRLAQKKNPLVGDRGHLHHILLSRGWSIQKIAMFYWVTTALFGIIGAMFPDKYSLQVFFIISGIVAFTIILLNLLPLKGRKQQQLIETPVPTGKVSGDAPFPGNLVQPLR